MSDADTRGAWLHFCATAEADAAARKDPQIALPVIAARYEALSDAERGVVDLLLVEQLAPNEPAAGDPWYTGENERWLSLFLIREYRIAAALPALRVLADWLETQDTPGAPYEWARVNGAVGKLVEG